MEYMSAGDSVKVRIAKAMVEAAEKAGKLISGKCHNRTVVWE
jgi:cysteine synthase